MTLGSPIQVHDKTDILKLFEESAIAAGRVILDIYRAGAEVRLKSDKSPVTEADEKAERLILDALARHLPDIPVVAEEEVAAGRIPDISGGRFILVDPLDGTREFIGGHDDFTVNIALIEAGKPILGVVHAPALGTLYLGGAGKAEKLAVDDTDRVTARRQIAVRPRNATPSALVSRSHNCDATDAYIKKAEILERKAVGSSLKFCLVAEGVADIYPRFSPTMEWDTAAGDAVLRAAGGMVTTEDGAPLTYGKCIPGLRVFENPAFVATGRLRERG
ncbi:3'(2'),5'-bisphosphate nucleotidase CysQ [Rhizobium rhizophilum]|uniref:3'(2'),5'-bisphosphate nucleotidase CysQ n=1 Tax=Rhizobium rhizophilum TaxID=1850373 RepID=A0ABY2QWI2_9HYPH|nr:3'(2'),5'-bisphosphate nucleotidase CysQ [Rhizobium rhizophilum]THV15435.1 3'(2'),5'-bisphosphate nucleotidase CysQ [Rhizobium rhizophilum]